jgi:protein involved in polysaccharide export with SLBB domain
MPTQIRSSTLVLAAVALSLLGPLTAGVSAQSDSVAMRRAFATRTDLEAVADAAERQARDDAIDAATRDRKRLEGQSLRERLREGDFQVGDRIVLRVRGDSSLTDTFTVRAGRTLNLPNIDEVALAGVLRSELHDFLSRHIGRYIRDPEIQTTSLMRLAVVGRVNRPGFLAVEPTALLTDVIMLSGGPSGDADLSNTVVRRGGIEVWNKKDVRVAMREGMTLDQLNLRAGDELVVGERRRRGFGPTAQVLATLSGVMLGIVGVTRGF